MNAEMPPFKNGEHNSESASTIDGVITPLSMQWHVAFLGEYKNTWPLSLCPTPAASNAWQGMTKNNGGRSLVIPLRIELFLGGTTTGKLCRKRTSYDK